jgi:catechol-2,3-dioxygenase
MLTALRRLGLEVADLDSARAFYEERLGLAPQTGDGDAASTDTGAEAVSAVDYAVGATTLRLRRPTDRPRGGVHTHYAFATTPAAYSQWVQRLADLDPVEFSFGTTDSLYVDDPAGHCVEIGSVDRSGAGAHEPGGSDGTGEGDDPATGAAPPLTGIFEVVLEVIDLAAAEERYRRLGFEVVDRGDERRRVRLSGPVDLELWEPQLGIADGRGGLHVDLAFETTNPDAAVEAGAPWRTGPYPVDGGLRVVDDDGHVLTFLRPGQ